MERISHYIGGKVVPGESGRAGPVYDSATGEQSHEVDFATADEVSAAVAAAREAFPAWRATSLSRRSEILFRIRQVLDARRRDIAALITAQHGKVLTDAMGEVARGLENVEYACGIPNLLKGAFSEQASTRIDVYPTRQPLGVVAGITLQLPGDGAHVDVRRRHCLREHLRAQAIGERSLCVDAHRRTAG